MHTHKILDSNKKVHIHLLNRRQTKSNVLDSKIYLLDILGGGNFKAVPIKHR